MHEKWLPKQYKLRPATSAKRCKPSGTARVLSHLRPVRYDDIMFIPALCSGDAVFEFDGCGIDSRAPRRDHRIKRTCGFVGAARRWADSDYGVWREIGVSGKGCPKRRFLFGAIGVSAVIPKTAWEALWNGGCTTLRSRNASIERSRPTRSIFQAVVGPSALG